MPKWVIVFVITTCLLLIVGVGADLILLSGKSTGTLAADVSNAPDKKTDAPTQPQVLPQNPNPDIENRLAKLELENQQLREQIAKENIAPVLPAKPTPRAAEMHDEYANACEPFLESLERIASDIQVSSPTSKIKDDAAAAIAASEAWKRNTAVVKASYSSKHELEDSLAEFTRYQEDQTAVEKSEKHAYSSQPFWEEQAHNESSAGLNHLDNAKRLLASADENLVVVVAQPPTTRPAVSVIDIDGVPEVFPPAVLKLSVENGKVVARLSSGNSDVVVAGKKVVNEYIFVMTLSDINSMADLDKAIWKSKSHSTSQENLAFFDLDHGRFSLISDDVTVSFVRKGNRVQVLVQGLFRFTDEHNLTGKSEAMNVKASLDAGVVGK